MGKVTVTTDGLSEAITRLQSIRDGLRPNVSKLLETAANDTRANIQAVYNGGQPAVGSKNGISQEFDHFNGLATATSQMVSETQADVICSGESVLFFEYGAGDLTLREKGHYPGEYSETHGQQYSRFGYWHIGGFKFTEVAPIRPVYYAVELARDFLKEHAKEVFNG